MPFLFRSKSSGLTQTKAAFNEPPSCQFFDHTYISDEYEEEYEEEEEEDGDCSSKNSPLTAGGGDWGRNYGDGISSSSANNNNSGGQLPPILDIIMTALRRSIVTCSVERDDDVASIDISWPTEVKHVSHVTFDRFNGFLGLPIELQHKIPKRVPSASVRVFGVSATSMQCSYDERGNSVPTILLTMQKHLYSEGGLQAEGIFRINAENSQEEFVRSQLNKGLVPNGIDVHCLAGLIKAWLRELPSGVLDALTAEQVLQCNTEDECSKLVKLLHPMEAALLDWTINLMADVVQHESYNKMNARNIAMVFAPNMTQMADPLTALMHAVQVMNFLKTLILKTIRLREEELVSPKATSSPQSLFTDSPNTSTGNKIPTSAPTADPSQHEGPISSANSASICPLQGKLGTQETEPSDTNTESHNNGDWLSWRKGVRKACQHEGPICSANSTSICLVSSPLHGKLGTQETEPSDISTESRDWLSWRKGVRKACQNSVFQLSKQISLKKTRSFGFLSGNGRGGGGEACA